MDISVSMREEASGRWTAQARGHPALRVSADTKEECLSNLRRVVHEAVPIAAIGTQPITLVVEVIPLMAGVAEAAQVMGWDKRRVITYINRGRFPAPVQALASGRIWIRSEVERFAADWRARRR